MKFAANFNYAGFILPDEYFDIPHCPAEDEYDDSNEVRADSRLIDIIESSEYDGYLEVVFIPDDATDIYVTKDAGGIDIILYAENGQIYRPLRLRKEDY